MAFEQEVEAHIINRIGTYYQQIYPPGHSSTHIIERTQIESPLRIALDKFRHLSVDEQKKIVDVWLEAHWHGMSATRP